MPTAAYNENIYKNGRSTIPLVSYSLTAPDSKEGGNLSLPPGNGLSSPGQIMNEIRALDAPIATLEPDYWRLDGSFVLPLEPSKSNMELGWWSDDLSDENGVLPEPLVIEREFNSVQTFNALGLNFDAASDNYCTDFDVLFYDAFGNLIHSESIKDNTSAYRRTEKAGQDILRIVIKLYKTNLPHRYARVIEIDFGIVLEYGKDVIKNLSLVREADPQGRAFPLPELHLRILNKGKYDQFDSHTYAPYFQTRQRFEYRHGLVLPDGRTEWVNCGIFYLASWSVSDMFVEFTAVGRSALLENSTYFGSSFQHFTVAQLVNRILPQAHITLESPKITGFFGSANYRRMLSILSELSCCLVYEDENNIIQFNDILSVSEPKKIREWNYLLGEWKLGKRPFSSIVSDLEQIKYKTLFNIPNFKLDEYYNAINLTEYTRSTEYRQISKTEQQPGEITIYFDTPIIGEPVIKVAPGFELVNIAVYTMYMTATLKGTGTAEIIIHGDSITLTKAEILYPAPWHTGREADNPYKVDLPCMIHGEGFEDFRDWFLRRRFALLKMRMSASLLWAQNPSLSPGEYVNVQHLSSGSNADMFITRQEIKYPELKGSTRLIGNVVMR